MTMTTDFATMSTRELKEAVEHLRAKYAVQTEVDDSDACATLMDLVDAEDELDERMSPNIELPEDLDD